MPELLRGNVSLEEMHSGESELPCRESTRHASVYLPVSSEEMLDGVAWAAIRICIRG